MPRAFPAARRDSLRPGPSESTSVTGSPGPAAAEVSTGPDHASVHFQDLTLGRGSGERSVMRVITSDTPASLRLLAYPEGSCILQVAGTSGALYAIKSAEDLRA